MKTTLTQPLYSLPYSLHDGYLTKLEADEETLVCHFPYGVFPLIPHVNRRQWQKSY